MSYWCNFMVFLSTFRGFLVQTYVTMEEKCNLCVEEVNLLIEIGTDLDAMGWNGATAPFFGGGGI